MPLVTSSTSAIQKPCRILRALSDPRNRRLSQIAMAAEIDKASALRVLTVLVEEGFLRRDPETKEYSYGPESYILSRALQDRRDLADIARPALSRLALNSGDLATLLGRSGFDSVCLDLEAGSFPMQFNAISVGTRFPLGVGCGGLALIAWCDDSEVESILAAIEPRLRRYPRLSVPLLRREIAAARQRGYVKLLNVIAREVGAIGYPVRCGARIIGAVSLTGLSSRVIEREGEMAALVAKAVADIERTAAEPAHRSAY
jgi:DNA-binding IclR family transcriptional regulator